MPRLQHFALCGLDWVFVGVDVPAGVEPPADLVVLHQQDPLLFIEDDRGGGEVPGAGQEVIPSRAIVTGYAATVCGRARHAGSTGRLRLATVALLVPSRGRRGDQLPVGPALLAGWLVSVVSVD